MFPSPWNLRKSHLLSTFSLNILLCVTQTSRLGVLETLGWPPEGARVFFWVYKNTKRKKKLRKHKAGQERREGLQSFQRLSYGLPGASPTYATKSLTRQRSLAMLWRKKSWLANHNSFKSSPTLRLEGPGVSAVIAAIALCRAPGKASAAVLTIPAFSVLVHLCAQLRDKVWVWLPHFVWDRAIKLQHLVWLRIFFSLLLSEPNDEDMKKDDFLTCHLDDSLEWKTGPSSKQDKRGPPPGSLELSSCDPWAQFNFLQARGMS